MATVDKFNLKADYKSIKEVDLKDFDTVFICVPELEKYRVIRYCLKKNKNFFNRETFIPINKKILILLIKD